MHSLTKPTLSTPAHLSRSKSKPSEIYAEKNKTTTTVQWTSGTLTLLDHGSAKVQLYSK